MTENLLMISEIARVVADFEEKVKANHVFEHRFTLPGYVTGDSCLWRNAQTDLRLYHEDDSLLAELVVSSPELTGGLPSKVEGFADYQPEIIKTILGGDSCLTKDEADDFEL